MSTVATSPEASLRNSAREVCWPGAGRGAMVVSFLLLLNFLYFLCSSGRVRTMDEVSAAFQAESLARYGMTAIPQAVRAQLFYGTIDRFGHPQSPYPPGQAMAMFPWYVAGQFAARHLPGIARGARDVVSDFFLTGESALFAALAAALALWIFLQLGIAPKTSLAAAAILALATPLAAYSGWLFSEPLAAALLLGAAAAVFAQPREAPITAQRALIAGVLLGAAIWVRPTHVLAVPVFLAAIFARDWRRGWSPALGLAFAAGIAAAVLLWRNLYLYGGLFNFGYPATAEGGRVLVAFNAPLARGLLGFLVSPGKSIFLFSPPILLALAGLPKLWRRDRGLALVAAVTPVVFLLFFARYTLWEGGYCYGPRYLVPSLALLGLGIGPALEGASRRVRRWAVVLFAGGLFVQVIGTATSFLEAAVAGGYYDAQYNYRMSYSPLSLQTRLLLHYASAPGTAPIGYGFDKWWVFLSKAGVSSATLLMIAGSLLLCAMFSAWWLRQAYSKTTASA